MNGYERMVKLMKETGKIDEKDKLRLGTMLDSERVRIGELVLDREDYMKSAHLTNLAKGDTMVVYRLDKTYLLLEKVV